MTAHTNNRLANMTIAPPNMPTRSLFPPEEKHGAMYTPLNDVKPTIAMLPYNDNAVAINMV
jgi:hypothetical protein